MNVGLTFLQKHSTECYLFLLKRIYNVPYISVMLTSLFVWTVQVDPSLRNTLLMG